MPHVEKEIMVQAPPETAYQVWRNFQNFPGFMENVEEVYDAGQGRTHWKAKGPLGTDAEWDAVLTVDEPGRAIGWETVENSGNVQTSGRVDFEPAGEQATRVHVSLDYEAPGGAIGEVMTKVFANPGAKIEGDLERFKAGIEESGYSAFSEGPVSREPQAPPGAESPSAARADAQARVEAEMQDELDTSMPFQDASGGATTGNTNAVPKKDVEPNRGHGTPGGSLGSVNETTPDPRRAAEKGDELADR